MWNWLSRVELKGGGGREHALTAVETLQSMHWVSGVHMYDVFGVCALHSLVKYMALVGKEKLIAMHKGPLTHQAHQSMTLRTVAFPSSSA